MTTLEKNLLPEIRICQYPNLEELRQDFESSFLLSFLSESVYNIEGYGLYYFEEKVSGSSKFWILRNLEETQIFDRLFPYGRSNQGFPKSLRVQDWFSDFEVSSLQEFLDFVGNNTYAVKNEVFFWKRGPFSYHQENSICVNVIYISVYENEETWRSKILPSWSNPLLYFHVNLYRHHAHEIPISLSQMISNTIKGKSSKEKARFTFEFAKDTLDQEGLEHLQIYLDEALES